MKRKALIALTIATLTTALAAGPFGDLSFGGKKIPGADTADKIKGMADKGADAAQTFSPEGQAKIGQTVALAATNQYHGLDPRENVQAYVTLVGLTIAHVPDPDEKKGHYAFAVLDSDDIAACSAPGGYVMITRGLLKMVSDESELAGVLGHEIAHVVKEHGMDAIRSERTLNLASAMSSDVSQFTTAADGFVPKLLSTPFSQSQETEADKAALNYLAKAGYDPQGYVRFLKKLQAAKGSNPSIMSTHPSTKDRIKAAEKNAKSGGATNADRFAKMTAG